MTEAPAISKCDPTNAARPARKWYALHVWSRPRDGPQDARGRRVILLAVLLAVTNAFDLAFTMLARHHELFLERNPIARAIMGNTPLFIAFKVLLVMFGIVVILRFRRLVLTEVLSWMACGVYSSLVFIWWRFFATLA